MNVCYLGPLKDYSGYGEANRHAVAALDAAGVYVIPELVSYSVESSDFGSLGKRIEPLFNHGGKYRIKILHTTPNVFKKHVEPGKYHIAHFFWETDRIPDDFVTGLNLCDEIWTGSEANKAALISTGVDKPVYIFPQAIETQREWPSAYEIPDFDGYLFYSIFEWTDRKNPAGLLDAFWREFQGDENVGLLIKTYFNGFSSASRRMIRHQIEVMKRRSGLDKFPPVFLYLDLMDRQQVMRLHQTGHAYVSAHRGEGWGVPQVEAALNGKPFISTGYGGAHEWFEHGKEALLIPFDMVPLNGMEHSSRWYTREQKWAEPDLTQLRAAMRYCYSHQGEAAAIGRRAQERVLERFNLERVGREMAERLKTIEGAL